jgi:DNA-binding MarR family transcriptional regulator
MISRARRSAGRNTPAPDGSAGLCLAESIAQPSMRRHQTDAAAIRHPLQEAPRQLLQANDDLNMDDPYTIVRLLHETARLWLYLYDRAMSARLPDMTRARCAVVTHLAQHEGVNQVGLAQVLGIRPITLVRLLDRLETAGFVTRMPDPHDRRAHVLTLTAKARPIIASICDLTRKTNDDLQLGISKAEARELRALLCRIRSNLAGRAGGTPSSEPLRTPDLT